jgi:hypothetical protein
MPRGGKREGAGRKPGVPNRVKVQAGLMRMAATRKSAGRAKLAVDVLQKRMNLFDRLADEALKDGEPALFTRYSKIAIECAVSLAGYQTPRLSAVMTTHPVDPSRVTKFTVSLFEPKSRRPLQQIEATPTAGSAPAIDAAAAPAPEPEAMKSEPSPAPPSSPPPEPNAYGTSNSGMSLWSHPAFGRQRHGTSHW